MAGTYYATTTEQSDTKVLGVTFQNTDPLVNLVPKSEGKIIDVVNDFAWTASPRVQESFRKVPVMYLQEREQEQNSLLSSALYYLNAINTVDLGEPDAGETLLTKLDKLSQEALGNFSPKNFIAGLKEILNKTISDDASLLQERLRSYIGIYLTKPTGFNYVLPFFNETPLGIISNWSGESKLLGNPLADTIDIAQSALERTAYMLNIGQPGTFIEKPKYFQYSTGGEKVTVSFPLFNTIKRSDKIPYQQNYELLWILAFQNKPYRTSFSRISPPKLYTLTIPGQKFMPYCYISNMDIKFSGTRRNLPVSIPAPNSLFGDVGPSRADFNTVNIAIPDVYIVSITFESLLADVANTMVDSGFTSKKISVGTVSRPQAAQTLPTPPTPAPPPLAETTQLPFDDRNATVKSVSNKSVVKDYKEMVNDVLGSDAVAKASGPRSELNLALTSTDRAPAVPVDIRSLTNRPTLPAGNDLGFIRPLVPVPAVTEPGPNFEERAATNLTSVLQRQRQSDLETFGPPATTDLNDLVSKIRPNPPSN